MRRTTLEKNNREHPPITRSRTRSQESIFTMSSDPEQRVSNSSMIIKKSVKCIPRIDRKLPIWRDNNNKVVHTFVETYSKKTKPETNIKSPVHRNQFPLFTIPEHLQVRVIAKFNLGSIDNLSKTSKTAGELVNRNKTRFECLHTPGVSKLITVKNTTTIKFSGSDVRFKLKLPNSKLFHWLNGRSVNEWDVRASRFAQLVSALGRHPFDVRSLDIGPLYRASDIDRLIKLINAKRVSFHGIIPAAIMEHLLVPERVSVLNVSPDVDLRKIGRQIRYICIRSRLQLPQIQQINGLIWMWLRKEYDIPEIYLCGSYAPDDSDILLEDIPDVDTTAKTRKGCFGDLKEEKHVIVRADGEKLVVMRCNGSFHITTNSL